MAIGWSEIQLRRLRELDAGPAEQQAAFDTPVERDREFQRLEHRLARARRDELQEFQQSIRVPRLCRLEAALADALVRGGFSRVVTPTLMSRALLERMSVTRDHPLSEQIFWLDEKRCLRPMLAPHLYHLLVDLLRVWEHPVRIFEIGSCFRRDTHGAQHAAEFTMLNLVEAGLPAADCRRRLAELAALVMEAAGVGGYRLAAERSAVYGETVDVVVPWGEGWLEVGSAAMGPHALDRAWKVADPWVGIGFGLERLVMAGARGDSLGRWGRSLVYLDGRRLNL
jgi:phenylalanyl-tRNA synthetase alpha chain